MYNGTEELRRENEELRDLLVENLPCVAGYRYTMEAPYDEDAPEFCFAEPVFTGNFYVVDCWIVNSVGERHPDYRNCAVPVQTLELSNPVKIEF